MDTLYVPGTEVERPSTPTKTGDWAASLPVLGIAIVALAGLSAWSTLIVAKSVLAAGLVPPDIPPAMVYVFVSGLQTCVALFGPLTAMFFRPFRIAKVMGWLVCLCAFCSVTGFECWHQVFRALQLSSGADFERSEEAEVERIQRSITDIAKQVPALYEAKRAAFRSLADDAAAGRDRTGIAVCGPICQGLRDRYASVTERFGYLNVQSVPGPVSGTAGIRGKLIDARHRLAALKAAEGSLVDFYAAVDRTAPPRMLTEAIAAVHERVSAKEQAYASVSEINAKTIAMIRTTEAFGHLAALKKPPADAWLPLAYGVLPSLAIFSLGLSTRRIFETRQQPVGLARLQQELAMEQEAESILRKLVRSRTRNFLNRLRASFRQWNGRDLGGR